MEASVFHNIPENNPASRLYKVLTKALEKKGTESVKAVFLHMFDYENHPEKFISALSKYKSMVDKVLESLLLVEETERTHYSQCSQRLTYTLQLSNFDIDWRSFQSNFDVAVMSELRFFALALSRISNEKEADEDALISLRDEIDELIETIEKNIHNDEIHHVILELLQCARNSISNYKWFGATRMKNDLEKMLGVMLVNHKIINNRSELIIRFWDILGKFNEITTCILNVPALAAAAGVIKALPS
jgi:hypothetical protein